VFGLGIQLAFQPVLDSLLIVYIRSGVGFGRVKHSRPADHGTYFVGLYLEEFRPREQNSKEFDDMQEGFSQSLRRLLLKVVRAITGTVARPDQI